MNIYSYVILFYCNNSKKHGVKTNSKTESQFERKLSLKFEIEFKAHTS